MRKKYNVGDIVFARSNPSLKLVVCEAINGYYCKELAGPVRAPQILFEKELFTSARLVTPQKPEPLAAAFKGDAFMSIWKNKPDKVKTD